MPTYRHLSALYARRILRALDNHRREGLDGAALCAACGVEEAEPSTVIADAFGGALEDLENAGTVVWARGAWWLGEAL